MMAPGLFNSRGRGALALFALVLACACSSKDESPNGAGLGSATSGAGGASASGAGGSGSIAADASVGAAKPDGGASGSGGGTSGSGSGAGGVDATGGTGTAGRAGGGVALDAGGSGVGGGGGAQAGSGAPRIVDAGPGFSIRDASTSVVMDCPATEPATGDACDWLQLIECDYAGTNCRCTIDFGGWRCTKPDGCTTGPAPSAYCADPGKQCAFAGGVSCECLSGVDPTMPESGMWSCIGPTGCPLTPYVPRCDPALNIYCDYHTGERCRCTAGDGPRCIPQDCTFDPVEGEPCDTPSPSEGCVNQAYDEKCLCDTTTDTWICNPLNCPGTYVPTLGVLCFSMTFPYPVCEYPEGVCQCTDDVITPFWTCQEP